MKQQRKGFTILEALIATATLTIVATLSMALISNIRVSLTEQKLRTDVSNLNSAVKVYLANGGDLTDVSDYNVVIAKLKTETKAESQKQMVGLKGSSLDQRMIAQKQSSVEESSDALRAIWSEEKKRFQLATSGAKGIAKFLLEGDGEATLASETRKTNLQYAKSGNWVWDYNDRATGAGPAPSSPPVDPNLPTLQPPTTPPTPEILKDPIIDYPGAEYPLIDYPKTITITNPNDEEVSELMVSVASGSWALYEGPVEVLPGDIIETQVITIDPDRYVDSSVVTESYTTGLVTPELALTLPSLVDYFSLGGEAMSSATPPPTLTEPGTVMLTNAADIPLIYQSSAFFQVFHTFDGSDPLSSSTRISGVPFSDGYVTQEISLGIDDWPAGATELQVKIAADALETNYFNNSEVSEATVSIDVINLRPPVIDASGEDIEMSLLSEFGDMPEGARIYYTTDDTAPGVGPDNEPTSGTLYSGPFSLASDAQVIARVFPPAGYGQWFKPSSSSAGDYVSPFLREVYIGGRFALADGTWRNIAKLGEDGSVDTDFNPGLGASFGSTVGTILPQNGGQILAGGDFDSMDTFHRYGVARLNNDGTVDPSFDADLD